MRSFASDNNAPIHPDVLQAIAAANKGHAVGYGADPWTEEATGLLQDIFGQDSSPFFVLTGTGANVLSLKALTRTHHAVLCAQAAHMNVDECGAPELITGAKLLPVPAEQGKITPDGCRPLMHGVGFEHTSQPRVVSITQCTELGAVYTPEEVQALAAFAHENDMLLHMDGSRLANAAAALDMGLRECTRELGVDVLSLGATKNGLLCGEAVVFLNPTLKESIEEFKYVRKQGMQLFSKMRYIGAQFTALLRGGLWLKNARHANAMARQLEQSILALPDVAITRPVQTNHVFAALPAEIIPELQRQYFFYVWSPEQRECRFVTSWDTSEEDVAAFSRTLKRLLG